MKPDHAIAALLALYAAVFLAAGTAIARKVRKAVRA